MNGAICAGGSPSDVSGNESCASLAISTRSHAAASPQPPPAAAPSTTASVGTGNAASFSSSAPNRRFAAAIGSGSPAGAGSRIIALKPPKSPPAQNMPPAPRSTSARTAASPAARSHSASSAATRSSLSALRLAGRFSVANRTPSACATCSGAGVEKVVPVIARHSRGSVPSFLQMMPSITSSAPPPIEKSRVSR